MVEAIAMLFVMVAFPSSIIPVKADAMHRRVLPSSSAF